MDNSERILFKLLCVLAGALIGLMAFATWQAIHPMPIPVEHLHGACKVYYDYASAKVKVCP